MCRSWINVLKLLINSILKIGLGIDNVDCFAFILSLMNMVLKSGSKILR